MKTRDFIRVVFIETPIEKVWSAITSDEFTRKFLGPVETDWRAGSRLKLLSYDSVENRDGTILVSIPTRVLSYTVPLPEQRDTRAKAEHRVTWLLESVDLSTKLKVIIHDLGDLSEEELREANFTWMLLLSCLKIGLESATKAEIHTSN